MDFGRFCNLIHWPPLSAVARRKCSITKIIHKQAKRWHFASMPAIEVAYHRSTKKNPPIWVSRQPMKNATEKTTPLKSVEPSHSQLESYELYETAPLKLLIKIIPVSNTKLATFGKKEDTKGKRKIVDAGLEGDYICNTKKAKLSAKFEAGVNSYSAHRAPFNPVFAHFGAGQMSSSAQRAPFSSMWRNVTVHDFESLHQIMGIFSCYELTHCDLIWVLLFTAGLFGSVYYPSSNQRGGKANWLAGPKQRGAMANRSGGSNRSGTKANWLVGSKKREAKWSFDASKQKLLPDEQVKKIMNQLFFMNGCGVKKECGAGA